MNILKYKNYDGSAEIDMDKGLCRGKILFIDDLITYEATSPPELKKEFERAVDDYLETCQQLGIEPQTSLKGQFNVRVSPAEHRQATIRAKENGQTLNDFVRDCIVAGITRQKSYVTHITNFHTYSSAHNSEANVDAIFEEINTSWPPHVDAPRKQLN